MNAVSRFVPRLIEVSIINQFATGTNDLFVFYILINSCLDFFRIRQMSDELTDIYHVERSKRKKWKEPRRD